MIRRQELALAGTFTKTHGIKGELSALLSVPHAYFDEHPLFVCEIDGIFVPFFIASIRSKSLKGVLIKPEDVDSEHQAKLFVGKEFYIIKEQLLEYEQQYAEEADEPGVYADDLAGYCVIDESAGMLGEIVDIEDSTANLLFILRTPQDRTLYIPIAEPFIESINHDTKTISMRLPEGLVDLNN